ncbi:sodium/solute symporter [uncultured Alistipes sp.]|uniref:sodium:solute symporter family transporter n=1 Tax=uncultured Alistipes sp. TaxID=538949 RepID=UPI0026140581|nr:sodium/solute symporter [uncultured Alistipes sp.]
MLKRTHLLFFVVVSLYFAILPAFGKTIRTPLTQTDAIVWDDSLCLPGPNDTTSHDGLAGAFVGRNHGHTILAGGANFPNCTLENRGDKCWYRDVYVYDGAQWQIFRNVLPQAVAYGVSITLPEGILCIGGCNASQCLSEVYLLSLEKGQPVLQPWPELPVPLANAAGCLVDGHIYVAGGNEKMDRPKATNLFFSLDTAHPEAGWSALPSWPGAARGYAIAVGQSNGQDNCFYLFAGRDYDSQDEVTWKILQDGFCYNPRLGQWTSLGDGFPVMAGSAVALGTNHILFLGGKSSDKTTSNNALRLYHTVTKTIVETDIEKGQLLLPVTTTAIFDGAEITIASGETAPGLRTPVILRGKVENTLHRMSWLDMLVITLYFLSLAWIGWYFSRKQKSTGDYFKGGGRIPWFVVGLSIFGTSLSAITFMAIPAKAYATDWSYLLFNAGIILVVPLIVGIFIPFFRQLNVTTAYEYLELRFNSLIRIICSIAFILFQMGRMAVVLLLPSIALNVVTGFDIFLCIGLMGVLSLAYTLMGGIEAVVWTEALQVVVLLGAAIAVGCSIASQLPDGFGTILCAASAAEKFSLGQTFFDLRQPTIWTVLIATVFTNITTYGTDQTIVQRYLTTNTEHAARKGVYTNAVLTIPASLLFFFLGTALWVFYKYHPSELSVSITDSDAILPWYMSTALPRGILGLVIAGLFAAAMSTLSSSMNSAATAFITDIYRKVDCRKNDRQLLGIARWATFLLGMIGILFAFVMASWDVKSLWDEFSKILGILLGGLGGLFLLGLITRRANAIGAFCGIFGSIIVQLLVTKFQWVNLLLYSTTGFIACFVIGYVVSLLTGGSSHTDHLTIYKTKNRSRNV